MRHLVAALASIALFATASAQQPAYKINTEKGEYPGIAGSHPLSFWTNNPLRMDLTGDLMIGFKAKDGQPLKPHDFRTHQQIIPIGKLAGFRIFQLMTTIWGGPRVAASSFPMSGAAIWKDILVSDDGGKQYVEIYALRYDGYDLIHATTASIYGSGPNAFLGTYDPGTGNGGGCVDGYWWFDKQGPHLLDFSPTLAAIRQAIPANATFTSRCWALHPEKLELRSNVQQPNAACNGCGQLGEVKATYRIEQGFAKPVAASFQPSTP